MIKIAKHIPKGIIKNNNIILQKARGCWITDKNGIEYLDMTSGIGALSTGHCHPKITTAIKEQIDKVVHAQQNCFFSLIEQEKLLEKMIKILPENHDNVFFTNSGSEATDNAIKIARMSTKKQNIISVKGGFHGRTLCAMSLTSSKVSYRQGFQPLIPGVFFCDDNINSLKEVLENQTSPDETCALIMEPIIGEGGIKELSPEFVKHARKICSENNIKLIFDEVQCGSGRSGYWWVSDKLKITPDIMTFAKGIGSGFPIGGVSANNEIFNTMSKNSLGGTYNGNVISTVAASQTIDIIEEENLLQNAIKKGEEIKKGLKELPYIEDIRQYGLFIGVDINKDFNVKDIIEKAINHQLILISCGTNTLRIIPPLIISSEEIEKFIHKLELVLHKL